MNRIAFVRAGWHADLLDNAVHACRDHLVTSGVAGGNLDEVNVPGSLEIPLVAKKLAETGRYDAVLCFGLVVDGGIYRHDFVASAVIDGIVRASLDTGVPVLSAVLTPHHFHEHETHHGFFAQHLVVKGRELAEAALRVVATLNELPKP